MPFTIIVGCSKNGGIGFKGRLAWKNKEDMKYFRETTKNTIDSTKINAIIMGRKTFESLNCKPLPNRINICITSKIHDSNQISNNSVIYFNNIDEALCFLYEKENIEKVFVIGGEYLYKIAINHSDCNKIIINIINIDVDCDTFFPTIDVNKFVLKEQTKLSEIVTNYIYILRS